MAYQYLLSIDTSCDDSCVAIIDIANRKLLADVVHTHSLAMSKFGGVVPEVASREHLKALPVVVESALSQAKLSWDDISLLSVSNRPGLIGALLVGLSYVKALSFAKAIPFCVVDHIEAHLYSPFLATLEGHRVAPLPWIALVVSGGHTELFLVEKILEHRWLGGKLDDAAGEAFDKVGKLIGLDYPAGPLMDQVVREKANESDRNYFSFPKSKLEKFNYSFSGFKTAVSETIRKQKELSDEIKLKIIASAQETIVDSLIYQIDCAKKAYGVSQVVVTGGVACNSRLREKLPAYYPKPKHCSDNAAMIANLTLLYIENGKLNLSGLNETAHSFSLQKA